MKPLKPQPRTCWVQIAIVNDKGEQCVYTCKPVPAAELGQSVAGYRLTNMTRNPSPVYTVVIESGGIVTCDCPQHGIASTCKHCEALVAAGIVPTALVADLREQKRLLDGVEHDFACRDNSIKNLLDSVSSLKEKNDLLQTLLDEAQDFLLDLEKPRRRPAARKVA